MSYESVADNELAAVVTYLDMRQRPEIAEPRSTLDLVPIPDPTADRYRELFRRMLRNAERMPEHYREAQHEWLALAREQVKS